MKLNLRICLFFLIIVFVAGGEDADGSKTTDSQDDYDGADSRCVHGCWNGKECECGPGYVGADCNADYCATFCSENQKCDLPAKLSCSCKDGYISDISDGLSKCVYLVCTDSSNCENGGTCNKNVCSCADGYTGDNCENELECWDKNEDCGGHGYCIMGNKCKCHDNYSGYRCTNVCTSADSKACHGHGQCNDGKCICEDMRTGDRCETELICKVKEDCNNGDCLLDHGGCVCDDGYTGKKCDAKFVCGKDDDCNNHGSCKDNVCSCLSSYTGSNCETKFVCGMDGDCNNNSSCKDNVCSCHANYTGSNCETKILCQHNGECQNGANCTVSDFTCECIDGFHGEICEYACLNDTHCGNNGTCAEHHCTCKNEYFGAHCDKEKICNGDCQNGGTCSDVFTCDCKGKFTGDHCEIEIKCSESEPCGDGYTCKESTCECKEEGKCASVTEPQPTEKSTAEKTTLIVTTEKSDDTLPSQFGMPDNTHFMAYLLVAAVVLIVVYVVYHNRSKLIGVVFESGSKSRPKPKHRPDSKDYERLEENVSESLSKGSGKSYIY